MRILFIITGLKIGGAEHQLCSLADELSNLGHHVMVISLSNDIELHPQNKNIIVTSLNMRKNIISVIKSIMLTKNIIKKFKPDVVHSHMIHANIFTRFLRLFITIPKVISTAHSCNDGGLLRILAYRLTHHLADLSTNVSLQAVESFEKKGAIPKGGMKVQYNGINIERFANTCCPENSLHEHNISSNSKIILAIGRLTKAKDYPNLFDAIKKLKRTDITLLIAGDGELRDELSDKVTQMGLSKQVRFLGNRKDIPVLIKFADLLVLSSEWEGFPTVIGEAIAGKCLIVSTDAGGAREWLPQEHLDLIVPTKNSTLLARKIEQVLNLDSNSRELIVNSLNNHIINNFSLNKIARDWIKIYRN